MIYTVNEIRQLVTPVAKKYNLAAVYLFGSYARGQATEKSDVDLIVDTTGTSAKGLFALGAIYCDFENALQKDIDLITVDSLRQPARLSSDIDFRNAVEKEHVILYISGE